MKKDDLRDELCSIRDRLEEIIGVCLGHAPSDFYSEDEDGNRVIIMSKAEPFARLADGAFQQLYALTAKL